jgi:hypothetical protein
MGRRLCLSFCLRAAGGPINAPVPDAVTLGFFSPSTATRPAPVVVRRALLGACSAGAIVVTGWQLVEIAPCPGGRMSEDGLSVSISDNGSRASDSSTFSSPSESSSVGHCRFRGVRPVGTSSLIPWPSCASMLRDSWSSLPLRVSRSTDVPMLCAAVCCETKRRARKKS